jgi:hypothetical protein
VFLWLEAAVVVADVELDAGEARPALPIGELDRQL